MSLPRLEWSEVLDKPIVLAPVVEGLPTSQGSSVVIPSLGPHGGFHWGSADSWWANSRKLPGAWVTVVAFELTLPDADVEYDAATNGIGGPTGSVVESLFHEVDPWFERLLEWVGVASDQDTDYSDPLKSSSVPGLGLTVRAFKPGEAWSRSRSANSMVVHNGSATMLSLERFRKVLARTNAGNAPSDARMLLRDAYIDLRRGRLRKAVIDAGAATELVLGDWHAANGVKVKSRPTLGDQVAATTAPIPGDSRTGLVLVRNDAIHNNITPSQQQTMRALRIAREVVDLLEPLGF